MSFSINAWIQKLQFNCKLSEIIKKAVAITRANWNMYRPVFGRLRHIRKIASSSHVTKYPRTEIFSTAQQNNLFSLCTGAEYFFHNVGFEKPWSLTYSNVTILSPSATPWAKRTHCADDALLLLKIELKPPWPDMVHFATRTLGWKFQI